MDDERALGIAAAAVVAAVVALALLRRRDDVIECAACATPDAAECHGNELRMHEVKGSNPCLVVRARLGAHETVFCVDTGFAGPCLLSLPCLAHERTHPAAGADVAEWCDATQRALARSGGASQAEQEAALQRFLRTTRSSDFTSGCTMRLASIGATKEQTSEILLAPPLALETKDNTWSAPRACSGQPVAELLTSTPMATLHLLTCDWLAQNSPALLLPADGALRTNLSADEFAVERRTLRSLSRTLSGGAFVATVRVEGVGLRVTVDTGAACYLSIGKQAASKLAACKATNKSMQQLGVNGERVCSTQVLASVELAGELARDVPVLVNDMNLDGEDGYVGICFLRHFDLCVTPRELFARRNALPFDLTLLDAMLGERPCGGPPPACAR